MSEPWPPAFMRTAPPTEPGTPTAHDSPLHPASATRRASTGRATAAPARTTTGAAPPVQPARRQVDAGEPRAEMQHDPVEPLVRHQQVGAAAEDEDRRRRCRPPPRAAPQALRTAARSSGPSTST